MATKNNKKGENKQQKKPITEGAIKKMIAEKARYYDKRNELWEEAKDIDRKFRDLKESHNSFASSFGFKTDDDYITNNYKTGFENDMELPGLSQLGQEIQAAKEKEAQQDSEQSRSEYINQQVLDQFKNQLNEMKEEIDQLKKENKKLKEEKGKEEKGKENNKQQKQQKK